MLYIHIPYCDSKCNYCSFNSYTTGHGNFDAYIEALIEQFKYDAERFKIEKREIETIFIGGGTPSVLEPDTYLPLIESITPYMMGNCEFTTEANPNSATRSWIDGMRQLGVNRISFGVQSFEDKKLKALGRSHSSRQAVLSLENAVRSGYENISLDLIYDHILDERDILFRDIKTALAFPITHISAYELSIEANTRFSSEPSVKQNSESLGRFVAETISNAGFEHYEISNFGKIRCRHNMGYWSLHEYIGLGAGAVGFVDKKRFYKKSLPEEYIDDPLHCDIETIDSEKLLIEKVFLGMRSDIGVQKTLLDRNMLENIEILIDENRLREEDGVVYNDDFFLADEISLFILG